MWWGNVRKLLRALSPRDEFIIVTVAAFVPFLVVNLLYVVPRQWIAGLLTGGGYTDVIIVELIVLVILAGFLHIRGWSFESIGLGPNFRETVYGLGFALLVYLVLAIPLIFALLSSTHMWEATENSQATEETLDPTINILVSVINPVFEEVFECGYVITALRKHRSTWIAVGVSVALRASLHVYQGIAGVSQILPLGLIFAYWYVRSGRLWPLIVAHVVFDFVPGMLGRL